MVGGRRRVKDGLTRRVPTQRYMDEEWCISALLTFGLALRMRRARMDAM